MAKTRTEMELERRLAEAEALIANLSKKTTSDVEVVGTIALKDGDVELNLDLIKTVDEQGNVTYKTYDPESKSPFCYFRGERSGDSPNIATPSLPTGLQLIVGELRVKAETHRSWAMHQMNARK